MKVILQVESTLTDRHRTTVPESVRGALRLDQLDKLVYTIQPDGEVVLRRARGQGLPDRGRTQDPVLLRGVDSGLAQRIKFLVGMRSDPP
ncbi:type II toxin-antitoxin system PrlF family antitoxin [Paracidovorax cattleyae]|uniref:type II toxin-antitoxin system PrlF family antitoxin n=1 Tax=Paracidovorax cattleyae TaxID=80868 RepID=UPI0018AFE026|nr:type II toxin-antitoxin system PrlF family antitoxin [Paracidovorax cattleyae]MBF9263444.1 type II toxin-antitoxin system PrlF family antitoxin [Paracidovorax cattleyae]